MSEMLAYLVQKAAEDRFFFGSMLAAFARSEQLTDAALAVRLGCTQENLSLMKLCRAPRSERPAFDEDVECIAHRFGLKAEELSEIALRGEVLLSLRSQAAASTRGLLAAAREAETPEHETDSPNADKGTE